MDKYCETCKHHYMGPDEFFYCVCDTSDYCTDCTPDDFVCEEWEEK